MSHLAQTTAPVMQILPENTIADRLYRKIVYNAIRWIKGNVPAEVYIKYSLDQFKDPTAIPSDRVIAMARDMEMPLSELIKNGIGACRFTVIEFQIALAEESSFSHQGG